MIRIVAHMQRHQKVLLVVQTDSTFTQCDVRGSRCWVGKCIHCNAKLVVTLAGETSATIEHIEPKTHGGDECIENIALACARCNAGKGMRLDHRSRNDPTLTRVIESLLQKRRSRLRNPP